MANNKNSFYDPGLIIKEVHDFHGQFIRTGDARAVVSSHFSHFRATYDNQNRPLSATYYLGTLPHITTLATLSAGSLGGKYFTIRAVPSDDLWAIWYNVNGASSAPVISGARLVEVPILSSDDATLVALATSLTVNSTCSGIFTSARYGSTVTITSVGQGVVQNSTAGTTGFLITNTAGAQEKVGEVSISYSGNYPIYNGQELRGYQFDLWKGTFVPLKLDTKETIRIDEVSSTLVYVGYAVDSVDPADSVWKIARISTSGSETKLEYAGGSSSYAFVWNNRGILTYE